MRNVLLRLSMYICVAMAVAVAGGIDTSVGEEKNLKPRSSGSDAIDWNLIDSGDGGVDSKAKAVVSEVGPEYETEKETEYNSIDPVDAEWGTLEEEDEYAFVPGSVSVRNVPKNTKALDDIFYLQPRNIKRYAPGQVIRMREVTPDTYPAHVRAIYQYMVRSTDSLDVPVGVVATLYVSLHADGQRLLSFQVPTDLPCIDCAPSVDMLDSMRKLERPLAYGWNVVAPDFQGLRAAFGAAKLAGQATLDSVRGALVTGSITGISPTAQFAMWGYSGGSIATGWAAALQPQYAPELGQQLVGAALGGWITSYDATIKAADGKLAAGLVGLALSGLAQQYTELVPVYRKYIRSTTKLKAILEGAKQTCLTLGVFKFLGAQFFKGSRPYFRGGDLALKEPTVRRIIDDNTVAMLPEVGVPECPLFLHHAVKDNIAPVSDTKRAVRNYCAWGIQSFEVNFVQNTGHMSQSREGPPAVVAWLKTRFDGVEPAEGCIQRTWDTLRHYPGIDTVYFEKRYDEAPPLPSLARLVLLPDTDPRKAAFVRTFLPLA